MQNDLTAHGRYIFLSYRREDAKHSSELLYQQLAVRFGPERVLKDVHSVSLGQDFREWISQNVQGARVMLVVIGPHWLETMQSRSARQEPDFVLGELEEALRWNVPAFAVLVDGARQPSPESLPATLKAFSFMHSTELPDPPAFQEAVGTLGNKLTIQFPDLRQDNRHCLPEWQRRARWWFCGATAFLVAIFGWWRFGILPRPDGAALSALLHETIWVEYSPPREEAFGWLNATEENELRRAIIQELNQVAQAGFTGVLVNGDTGSTAMIPVEAKNLGLKVIIVCGLTGSSANREQSLARCYELRHSADGYCIGYNSLGQDYQLQELKEALRRLRRRTGIPTTTTQLAARYVDSEALCELGDWLFPDVHPDLMLTPKESSSFSRRNLVQIPQDSASQLFSANPERDLPVVVAAARQMAALARKYDRPLVYNGVGYPAHGIPNATPEVQARFFTELLLELSRPANALGNVSCVIHSSHDRPWKVWIHHGDSDPRLRPGCYEWMGDTGLFEDPALSNQEDTELPEFDPADARPAVWEILQRHPRWQGAIPKTSPR